MSETTKKKPKQNKTKKSQTRHFKSQFYANEIRARDANDQPNV